MAGLLVYYSDVFRLHYPPRGSGHLESPLRLWRARRGLSEYGLDALVDYSEPGQAGLRVYSEVHDPAYLAELEAEVESGMDSYFIDADTYVSPGTGPALEALAAAVLGAVERVRRGEGSSLILGRPPGHHAGFSGPGLGAPSLGGCLVNTAALAAFKLARAGYRVAVFDFDLNHGNGTEELVEALGGGRVAFIDVHQDWRETYPWTGEPGGRPGAPVLNVNLPRGSGDDLGTAVMAGVRGVLEDLNPDVVVVSAGFDAYRGDSPMTMLRLGSQTFHAAGRAVAKWPVIAVLETGFTAGLERGLPAFTAGLLGRPDPVGDPASVSGDDVWRVFEELNRGVLEA